MKVIFLAMEYCCFFNTAVVCTFLLCIITILRVGLDGGCCIGDIENFRQVCRGRIVASRAVYPLYRVVGTVAAGWCRPCKPFRHNKKPHHAVWHSAVFGAPAGTRILDPLIKSQMLYQLSYEHICVCCVPTALIL